MPLTLVTAPTLEPLTVTEVRTQLKLGTTVGEPAPTAPTVALASPAIAGNVDNGAHRYAVTCVTADGETERGVVSSSVTVADKTVNGKVELTAILLGGSSVTSRKLYRTAAGGTTYFLLATLSDNTTIVYTDNIADASLGAEVPSTNTTIDPELTRLIVTAREHAEAATNRALITQTWQWVLDGFPADDFLELPKPPLQSSGLTLKYYDTAGTLQPWAATNYDVQAPAGARCARGRVMLSYGIVWPSTYGEVGDVIVQFVAGYGSARSAVPAGLRDAQLIYIEGLFTRDRDLLRLAHDLFWSYRSFPTQGAIA